MVEKMVNEVYLHDCECVQSISKSVSTPFESRSIYWHAAEPLQSRANSPMVAEDDVAIDKYLHEDDAVHLIAIFLKDKASSCTSIYWHPEAYPHSKLKLLILSPFTSIIAWSHDCPLHLILHDESFWIGHNIKDPSQVVPEQSMVKLLTNVPFIILFLQYCPLLQSTFFQNDFCGVISNVFVHTTEGTINTYRASGTLLTSYISFTPWATIECCTKPISLWWTMWQCCW